MPVELTQVLTPHLRVMRGTERKPARCIALQGEVGVAVSCSIHPRRASVCREYPPSFEDGLHNPRCDEARQAHGMAALTPADWSGFEPDAPPPVLTPPRAA
ncbi:ferredoxin [Oceanococcus atlanticus]|uniref:Ferredoxin n=1 Tax=Oceanococcus atlanticus TaxID=1317117 RepID=A0A1Y1SDV6_9GAMM|nr:ferredoxin [Oceanococcus atlanticus]